MTGNPKDPLHGLVRLGNHYVPGIWNYLLPYELDELKVPSERRASCMNCPKAAFEGFRDDYRCCTYHPRVPNYMLGLAAQGKKAKGIIEKMNRDGFLLPDGFVTTPGQWADFLADVAEDRFGKSESVLCPFLERKNGHCNIYAYRNGVCSTFFCQHDHGDRGENFWEHLQETVSQVELALSQWCLSEIGFDVTAYFKRMDDLAAEIHEVTDPATNGWSDEHLDYLWGDKRGRELETYAQCAALVSKNRHDLWEIACRSDILEASQFDQASIEVVPKEYQDEIDEEDFEPGETTPPYKLWQQTMTDHRKLWRLPSAPLVLNKRISFHDNEEDSEESQYYKDQTVEMQFGKRKSGKKYKWRHFMSAEESEGLKYFDRPRVLSRHTLAELKELIGGEPRDFICEWYARDVLVESEL